MDEKAKTGIVKSAGKLRESRSFPGLKGYGNEGVAAIAASQVFYWH